MVERTPPPPPEVSNDDPGFDAGRLCLQFLAAQVHQPTLDLRTWASATLDVQELVMATAAERADAQTLQGAIARIGVALAGGQRAPIGDIARVNRIAAMPDLAPQMGIGRTRDWAWPATFGQVLSTLARDTVSLLTSADRDRVRRCAAQDCDRLFVDTSRPGQRRWCSMARCGNRAKVRAFRGRAEA
ncbi:MAG: CGNR zinc finger domain-containing protein [Euzebya sp.]